MRAWAVRLSAIFLALPACFFGTQGDEYECDPAPVLAASSVLTVATSCAATVEYEGKVYNLGCAPVHPSRVGGVFEHGGGETEFRGAKRIVGVPIARLFILMEGGMRSCGRVDRQVAGAGSATIRDYRTAESPLRDE